MHWKNHLALAAQWMFCTLRKIGALEVQCQHIVSNGITSSTLEALGIKQHMLRALRQLPNHLKPQALETLTTQAVNLEHGVLTGKTHSGH